LSAQFPGVGFINSCSDHRNLPTDGCPPIVGVLKVRALYKSARTNFRCTDLFRARVQNVCMHIILQYSTVAMADSTTCGNNYLKNWSSCETLSEEDTIVCINCKSELPVEENTVYRPVLVVKSIVLLHCKDCLNFCHLHCEANQIDLDPTIAIELIRTHQQHEYRCRECRHVHNG